MGSTCSTTNLQQIEPIFWTNANRNISSLGMNPTTQFQSKVQSYYYDDYYYTTFASIIVTSIILLILIKISINKFVNIIN